MGYCDCNYVVLQKNRASCALNNEILDLLNVESVSGACSGRVELVYNFDAKSTTSV